LALSFRAMKIPLSSLNARISRIAYSKGKPEVKKAFHSRAYFILNFFRVTPSFALE